MSAQSSGKVLLLGGLVSPWESVVVSLVGGGCGWSLCEGSEGVALPNGRGHAPSWGWLVVLG